MATFILRNIGWPYNDSTYERDAAYGVVEVFENEADALEMKRWLDREYLIYKWSLILRYEGYVQKEWDFRKFRDALDDFLVAELHLNPSVKLKYFWGPLELEAFFARPTDVQWDRLVELLGVEFFTISKLEEGEPRVFRASVGQGYGRYGEEDFLMDYYGEKDLYFASPAEAMAHFIKDDLTIWSSDGFKTWLKFKGTYDQLSELPEILRSLVESNEAFRKTGEGIEIIAQPTVEAMNSLNALLRKPFLVMEEAPLNDVPVFPMREANAVIRANEEQWKEVEILNFQAGPPAVRKNTLEYLQMFETNVMLGGQEGAESPGYKKLRELLGPYLTGGKFEFKFYYLTYNEVRLSFVGAVRSCKIMENETHVDAVFGFQNLDHQSVAHPVEAAGADIDEAFLNAFFVWLQANAGAVAQEILKRGK